MFHTTEACGFVRDEAGEATVNWVLLSAGAIVLALAAITLLGDGMEAKSELLATTISERPVGVD